jgi:hypothetical protein
MNTKAKIRQAMDVLNGKPEAKPMKPTKPKTMGRPSIYTEALGIKICAHIAMGKSLVSICKREGMPSVETVYMWLKDPNKADFLNTYTRAREDQADTLADEIIDIADDGLNDTYIDDKTGEQKTIADVVARSKLRVEARKWVAAKLKPKKYGDKVEVTGETKHSGEVGLSHKLDTSNLSTEELRALANIRLTS